MVVLVKGVVDLIEVADFGTANLDEPVTLVPEPLHAADQLPDIDTGGSVFQESYDLPRLGFPELLFSSIFVLLFEDPSAVTTPSMIDSGLAAHPGTYTSTGMILSIPPETL